MTNGRSCVPSLSPERDQSTNGRSRVPSLSPKRDQLTNRHSRVPSLSPEREQLKNGRSHVPTSSPLLSSSSDEDELLSDSTDFCSDDDTGIDVDMSTIQNELLKVRRWGRRLKIKRVAEQRFLFKKESSYESRLLSKHPDIGKAIEKFVSEANVGADQWHRTGVLTFDGNNKSISSKVTYTRIQKYLESLYGHKIAYGFNFVFLEIFDIAQPKYTKVWLK